MDKIRVMTTIQQLKRIIEEHETQFFLYIECDKNAAHSEDNLYNLHSRCKIEEPKD